MLDKLKSITKTRFRRTNFNAFLFFLVLAMVIWIFAQFSKTYSEVVEIPLEYVNTPPDKFLVKENPEKVKLKMESTGFRLFYFSLFPPTLSVDISKAIVEDEALVYVIEDHRNEIESQLEISLNENQFVKSELRIKYQQRKEKIVPVHHEVQVEYAVGYAAAEELDIEPDSVTVSGPDNILDSLNQLRTVPLELKDVNQDLRGKIALDTANLSEITFYTNTINYLLDVEKFTEGSVEIPIDLINVPEGVNVVIFPKRILLFYQVLLKDYSSIVASDFRVVCDYNNIDKKQNFLIPTIVKQPPNVTNLRLNEKKIQFIIKK